MNIEGKKNLELLKRALDSHILTCCTSALRASDKQVKEKWDPEIDQTNQMLDAVQHNLGQYKEDDAEALTSARHSGTKMTTDFFR